MGGAGELHSKVSFGSLIAFSDPSPGPRRGKTQIQEVFLIGTDIRPQLILFYCTYVHTEMRQRKHGQLRPYLFSTLLDRAGRQTPSPALSLQLAGAGKLASSPANSIYFQNRVSSETSRHTLAAWPSCPAPTEYTLYCTVSLLHATPPSPPARARGESTSDWQ